jgi:hypothetical protein
MTDEEFLVINKQHVLDVLEELADEQRLYVEGQDTRLAEAETYVERQAALKARDVYLEKVNVLMVLARFVKAGGSI